MAGLKGNLSSIAGLKTRLRALPVTIANDVSQRAAPALTDLTVDAYLTDRTVYGESRPSAKDGSTLTLHKTGETRRTLQFVANGTIVRCVLGTKYARYLIGKYGILPNGALPVKWSRKLAEFVANTKVTP